jgi:hypothetical protein
MTEFTEAAERFRNEVNDHDYGERLTAEPAKWSQLCAAMDTLTDTAMGIQAFSMLLPTEDKGELYLRTYGLFQCMTAQQNAVICAARALQLDHLLIDRLGDIREMRDATIGHAPLKTRGKLRGSFGIVQISLTAYGFEWYPFDFETYKSGGWPRGEVFSELLKEQEEAVCDAIEILIAGMG